MWPQPCRDSPPPNSWEPTPGKRRRRETDPQGLSPRDPGTRDPGARDPSTRNPGTRDLDTWDLGTRHLGTRDPGTRDLGTWLLRTRDPGTRDLGTWLLRTRDPGTRDLGTWLLRTRDCGTRDSGTRDRNAQEPTPMTAHPDALVIGRAGLDLYPMPPGTPTHEAITFLTDMGGSAGNIAVAMAKQGAQVALAAPVSDDPVGQFVRARIAEYGITHVQGRAVDRDARTSLALAELMPDSARTVIYRNTAADFGLTAADLAPWQGAPLTVVTGTALAAEPSRGACLGALAAAAHGVLDLDYRPYSWAEGEAAATYAAAAAAADTIVGNDEEFDILGAGANPRDVATRLAASGKTVIFKEGAAGCTWMDGEGTHFVPAYTVDAMKPFGAGDAFLGVSLVALQRGETPAEALRQGAAAAALVVTRPGCASAMPGPEEVRAFRAQQEDT